MNNATRAIHRRGAFTLVEMIVVIGIILVIAALAAAFMPRVQDSTNLLRAVDQFEQWLLTAKMRAKHDQLATGIRFIPDPLNPGMFSEFQYIQQPEPLGGGSLSQTATVPPIFAPPPLPTTFFLNGSLLLPTPNPPATIPSPFNYPCPRTLSPPQAAIVAGQVQIYNFDPTMGGTPSFQWLVQPGDYLGINSGGVYPILGVSATALTTTANPPAPWSKPWPMNGVPVTTLQLGSTVFGVTPYDTSLNITTPTTNFRILRQPRVFVGEPPLQMPKNFAVDTLSIGNNIVSGPSGFIEILFAPSGAVIGTNAGSGKLYAYIHDITQNPVDPNRAGIVAVQTRTGFIGAYSMAPPPLLPTAFAEEGRESGL